MKTLGTTLGLNAQYMMYLKNKGDVKYGLYVKNNNQRINNVS